MVIYDEIEVLLEVIVFQHQTLIIDDEVEIEVDE